MSLLDFINPDPHANTPGPMSMEEVLAAAERLQAPWGRGSTSPSSNYPVDYSGGGAGELQNPSQPTMSPGASPEGLFNYATGLRNTSEGVMPGVRDLRDMGGMGRTDPSTDLSTRTVDQSGRETYTAKPSAPMPIIQNLGQLQQVMHALQGVPDELKTRLLTQWTGIPLTSEKAMALMNAVAVARERHALTAPEREQAAKDRQARIRETIKRDQEMSGYRRDLLGLHKSAQAQMSMRRLDQLIQAREKLTHLVTDPKTQMQVPNPAIQMYDKEIGRLNKVLDEYYSASTEGVTSGTSQPSGSRMNPADQLRQSLPPGATMEPMQ